MEVQEDVVARLERLDRERKEAAGKRRAQDQLRVVATPRNPSANEEVPALTALRLVRRCDTCLAGARRIRRNPSMRFGTSSTREETSWMGSSSG